MDNSIPLLTLGEASRCLIATCEEIDNAKDLTEELIRSFDNHKELVAEAIEDRRYVCNRLDEKIALARQYKDKLNEYIKAFSGQKDEIIERVKHVVAAHPANVPLKDGNGTSLFIKKSPAKLKTTMEVFSRTFTNLVYEVDVNVLIPFKYVKQVSAYQLDVEKLKADLKKGEKFEFASLEYGTHLEGFR